MTKACTNRVVVVEDDEDTRELLKELLEKRGVDVATAKDGVDALEVLKRASHVCLVLLDLAMPRMGGLEVLAAMAADPSLAPLPVCITSSAMDGVPAGVQRLPKPVDLDALYAIVDECCPPHAA